MDLASIRRRSRLTPLRRRYSFLELSLAMRRIPPDEQINEFQSMVRACHAADIEVVLDVCYNHTTEATKTALAIAFMESTT